MDRVYQSDVGSTPTPMPFPGSTGFPKGAVAWADFTPTTAGPYFFYYVAESIRAVIVAAGLTPDPTDLHQFQQALEIIAIEG